VQSLPHLRQSTKERLEKICEKAASSDAVAKRKAAVEACRELVNASPLPTGKQRDRALAACNHAGG
jgi:acetylglutamate kinase